jgi:hypothetical protein
MIVADEDPLLSSSNVVGIFINVVVRSQMILIQSERLLSLSTGGDAQGTSPSMVGSVAETFPSKSE